MAVRLTADIHHTEGLLVAILSEFRKEETARVMFLVPAGRGKAWEQRLRVRLSRERKAMKRKGKRFRHFTLRTTIHKHTEDGVRYDAVIMWQETSTTHTVLEALEGLLHV